MFGPAYDETADRLGSLARSTMLLDQRDRETKSTNDDMFKAVAEGLFTLADIAGEHCGKIQRELNELKAQVQELRGEIVLLTTPKRSRPKAHPKTNGADSYAHTPVS